jgi:hypothetical protein
LSTPMNPSTGRVADRAAYQKSASCGWVIGRADIWTISSPFGEDHYYD